MIDIPTLTSRIRINRICTGVLIVLLGSTFVFPDLLSVEGTHTLRHIGRLMIGTALIHQLFQLLFHTQMRDAIKQQQEDVR